MKEIVEGAQNLEWKLITYRLQHTQRPEVGRLIAENWTTRRSQNGDIYQMQSHVAPRKAQTA